MAVITGARNAADIIDFAQLPPVIEWVQRTPALVPIDFSTISDNVAVDIATWNFSIRFEAGTADYADGDLRSVKRLSDPQPAINPPKLVASSTVGEMFLELPADFYLPEVGYAITSKIPCVLITLVVDTGPLLTDADDAIRFVVIIRRGI